MIEVLAENYLCFAALIEMILKNQSYDSTKADQFFIANKLGVTVPTGYKRIVDNQVFSDNEYEYGIKINVDKLQDLLLPYKLSEIKNIPINIIDELSFFDTIKQYLNDRYWIICGFSYGMLYNEPKLYECGHVSLILNTIDETKILLYDPGPKNPGSKIVEENNLYFAMRRHMGALTLLKF